MVPDIPPSASPLKAPLLTRSRVLMAAASQPNISQRAHNLGKRKNSLEVSVEVVAKQVAPRITDLRRYAMRHAITKLEKQKAETTARSLTTMQNFTSDARMVLQSQKYGGDAKRLVSTCFQQILTQLYTQEKVQRMTFRQLVEFYAASCMFDRRGQSDVLQVKWAIVLDFTLSAFNLLEPLANAGLRDIVPRLNQHLIGSKRDSARAVPDGSLISYLLQARLFEWMTKSSCPVNPYTRCIPRRQLYHNLGLFAATASSVEDRPLLLSMACLICLDDEVLNSKDEFYTSLWTTFFTQRSAKDCFSVTKSLQEMGQTRMLNFALGILSQTTTAVASNK